jgi:hypothetical protein
MQRIQKSEATMFTNGATCEGAEYSFSDKALNIALVTVEGRYPESGYAMNEICKETAYIVSGTAQTSPINSVRNNSSPLESYYFCHITLTVIVMCCTM